MGPMQRKQRAAARTVWLLLCTGCAVPAGAVQLHAVVRGEGDEAAEGKPACFARFSQAQVENMHLYREPAQVSLAQRSGPRLATRPNMCLGGRLVPELYVLGPPKSATSSLAADLRSAGVASNAEPWKESNFFNCLAELKGDRMHSISHAQYAAWLAEHRLCPASDARRVVADYTPNNLRMVPSTSEDDLNLLGNNDLPRVLHSVYGNRSRELTFVVMLREPLARLQSAWYYDFTMRMLPVPIGKFESVLVSNLQTMEKRSAAKVGWPLSDSLYARQLKGWLRYFEPRQFYIVPFQVYVATEGGQAAVFRDLSQRIAFPLAPPGAVAHKLHGHHPDVDDDVTPPVIEQFNTVMEDQNADLVKLLANMSLQGAGLAAFNGTQGSEESVWDWLQDNW